MTLKCSNKILITKKITNKDCNYSNNQDIFIMAALCNRAGHYIFALWFLSSFYLFSSPNLSGRRLDVYHTSTHGVALVQIYNAGLKCAARGSLEIQDAKKLPFWRHRTTLLGYIFGTRACINNRKKLVKQQYLLHIP